MENCPKMDPTNLDAPPPGGTFWLPFSDFDFWMHFGRLLVPFGSIWLPFWLHLVHFWLLLAPFGTLLAHFGPFWHLLAPFWLLGSYFGSFWTLLVQTLLRNRILGHTNPQITCRFVFAPPTRATFRMHPNFPRPGAGILPQATEICSGPDGPGRVGVRHRRALSLHCTFSALHLILHSILHCTWSALHFFCTAPYLHCTSFCFVVILKVFLQEIFRRKSS